MQLAIAARRQLATEKRRGNMEGLKTVQLSTVVVTLYANTLLDNLPVS